ncbi:hypothetical protein ABZ235_18850 [Streptomyces canus]|uniref:hypothetical protein n=1 Tax=Streptomyces canus TaxID=58343 RepID=UPI0033AFE980
MAEPGQAFTLGSMALRAAWAAGHDALQREALQRLERRLPQGDFPNADLLPLLRQWWTEEPGGGAQDAGSRPPALTSSPGSAAVPGS